MAFLQYNDPLHIVWRKGTLDDPYVEKTDTLKIVNNIIVLSEIPSELDHVVIDNYVEVYDKEPLSNEFVVNYQNGIITFNLSEEGKIVTAKYKGKGIILYPASRIYTSIDDFGEVDRTLGDVVDNIDVVMNAVNNLDGSINEANTSKTELDNTIFLGDATKSNLDVSIDNANIINDTLSNTTTGTIKKATDINATLLSTISTSESTNTILSNTNSQAQTTKSNLNSSISTGNILKTNLDNNISTGTTLKIALDTNISDGNQLKTDLPPIINDANTAKTNLNNSISEGNILKGDLNNSISEGNILKDDLNDIITGTDYEQIILNLAKVKEDIDFQVSLTKPSKGKIWFELLN